MLHASVLCHSLTMTETNVRHLRRKNVKALRLAIELSEREANTDVVAKAEAVYHAKKQDRPLHRLLGLSCSSDSDLTDDSTSSSNDDTPPHADACMEEGHSRVDNRKGEGSERKW